MAAQPWLRTYPADVSWQIDLPEKPLYSLLDDTVARHPDHTAIDFLGRMTSYRELGQMTDRAAVGFQRLGVGKGVKVGLFLPNCPQFIACYYAILKAGGTVVNYSPLYAEEELLHQIEDSHTDIMVTLDIVQLYPKMATMLARSRLKTLVIGNMPEVLPFPKNWLYPLAKRKDVAAVPYDARHVRFKDLIANDGLLAAPTIDPREDVAVLQYTGGTTGVAKGAMLTHYNLYANVMQSRAWFPHVVDGQERIMGVLPFFHVFAMTAVMNFSISAAATIIMHPRFELEAVLTDIDKKKPTLMSGVPTMFTAINNHARTPTLDLTSIRACLSGGAPLPVEVKERFEKITGATLIEGYGLTETSPVAACNPPNGVNKTASIGLPLPGTTITITDPDHPERDMPPGEPGEIRIAGPQVMKGYWNRAEATADSLQGGRLRTGDIGYMDDEGYTFIIDRMKDMILCSGFNVYPRHVEEAIYRHPAVAEVTVIGVPDDYRGESPKAFVVLRKDHEPATVADIMAFLGDKLGRHELPSEIEFRDALPKTMIGKLSKKELVAEERKKIEARKRAAAG